MLEQTAREGKSRSTTVSERFPLSRRLTQAKQFTCVLADSRRFDAGGFLVRVRVNPQHPARLGLAIAKRCCPRAVDRNRLKRIARESFRVHAEELPHIDVVVLCTRKARYLTNRDLFMGLDRLWSQVKGAEWLEA